MVSIFINFYCIFYHWLPVQRRIQYKIAVITHKALSTSVPPYIDELLQRQVTTRSLRSTDAPRLSVPWTRTETAKRAFCVAAPNVWNDIRNVSSLSTFQAKLKTHFLLLHTHDEHIIHSFIFVYFQLSNPTKHELGCIYTHLRASVLTLSRNYRCDINLFLHYITLHLRYARDSAAERQSLLAAARLTFLQAESDSSVLDYRAGILIAFNDWHWQPLSITRVRYGIVLDERLSRLEACWLSR